MEPHPDVDDCFCQADISPIPMREDKMVHCKSLISHSIQFQLFGFWMDYFSEAAKTETRINHFPVSMKILPVDGD